MNSGLIASKQSGPGDKTLFDVSKLEETTQCELIGAEDDLNSHTDL